MATPAMESYHSFAAFGRLLNMCVPDLQHHHCINEFDTMRATSKMPTAPSFAERMTLADLADGPYYVIAMQLGPRSLSCVDVACRLTRALNRAQNGPWCMLGKRTFHGLELDGDSTFEAADYEPAGAGVGTERSTRKVARVDWKGRYGRFRDEVKMFRSPFDGSEIRTIEQPDEIVYTRCKIRTDLLFDASCSSGIYLEVEVRSNPDNVSLALVDFEGGGCSSVTFSPDTGAVIRERKVCEAPRKVEGTYILPLTTITSGQGFEGSMGLYLRAGHLAFFRRRACSDAAKTTECSLWESTGFVTDLTWAEGRRLTPCLAFRDVGTYQVSLTCVAAAPPLLTERTAFAYEPSSWHSLDWDATEQDGLEM